MSYLKFDKSELVNLEYALARELIRSNRAGSYASTTIVGCNTRKYHGLLICPLEEMDGEHHVLLSSLDATVIQHEKEFNLGIHKFEGDNYVPKGHKYIREFDATKGSIARYRVGGVVLAREMLLVSEAEQILIKYTLLEAQSRTLMRLKPFLAFRNYHGLSKSNLYVNTKYTEIENGIVSRLYDGYPGLHMQLSKAAEFVAYPDWHYNVEYMEEQYRGYDYKEDLYVPGYFEFPLKKGESVVFSASTSVIKPAGLKRRFTVEYNRRIPLDSFRNCLLNAAQQFIVRRNGKTEIKAGFPWYTIWVRDTFLALPGLTMVTGDVETARKAIDTVLTKMENGFFPNMMHEKDPGFHAADIPLWFIWVLQQYEKYDSRINIWKQYGEAIKSVLEAFRFGKNAGIRMRDNGLIHAAAEGKALTWMDAVVDGAPVIRRAGFAVEINALWYNGVCQSLKWASQSDTKFVENWEHLPDLIRTSFTDLFWDSERGYLADFADNGFRDFSVRPNQLIAAAMEYSPVALEMKKSILDVVESELLTPMGVRTLSPKNEAYQGVCKGDQAQRDLAYHQGTAWPWLLEHFAKAYLDVHKKSGQALIRRLYDGFEEHLSVRGLGTVSEIFDGSPPHDPRGTISQATSVAALLRLGEMIEGFEPPERIRLIESDTTGHQPEKKQS